jgi:ferredoxin
MACAFFHFSENNPKKSAIKINESKEFKGRYEANICTQCGECASVCPVEAIYKEGEVYRINRDKCISCYACKDACPENAIVVYCEGEPPIKCDLCGECAKICPTKSLYMEVN